MTNTEKGLQGEGRWRREFGTDKKLVLPAWEDFPSERPEWIDRLISGVVAGEVETRLGEAGWYGSQSGDRRLRNLGAAPIEVARSSWLARFNPGLSAPGPYQVFMESDPLVFYPWDSPAIGSEGPDLDSTPGQTTQAEIGSRPQTRTGNTIRDVAVGDFVFVLRTRCQDINKKVVPDPSEMRSGAHIVGVWWVVAKCSYPSSRGAFIHGAYCLPLVKFTEPVHVNTARKFVPALMNVTPLTMAGGILPLREQDSFCIAAACALPMEIFNTPNSDLFVLSAELKKLNTGPIKPMLDYMKSATVRYEAIRDIELAAMVTVKDKWMKDGFAIADVSSMRGIGYDLAASDNSHDVTHEIEVKGTNNDNTSTIKVTTNEYKAAEASQASGRWQLHSVTRATHPDFREHLTHSAVDVVPGWKDRISDAKTSSNKPLTRILNLPASDWKTIKS